MACERAVLIFDNYGSDGMLTEKTHPHIKQHNFSGRCYKKPFSIKTIVKELKTYSANMGPSNRTLIEKKHDAHHVIEKLQDLYAESLLQTPKSHPFLATWIPQKIRFQLFPFLQKLINMLIKLLFLMIKVQIIV